MTEKEEKFEELENIPASDLKKIEGVLVDLALLEKFLEVVE